MSRKRCKVDEAVDTYDLQSPPTESGSVHDYLVARWTGARGFQAVGYRKLADWFNTHLLRQVYDAHGRSTIGTRVESDYEALTEGDELVRDEIINDLRADGIDAEALVDAMVSPRTMHRHLTGCLGAEKETLEAQTDWERESVAMARRQLEAKVAKAASSLASKDEFHGADTADIDIRIYLSCPDCTARIPFDAGRHQGYVCENHHKPPGAAAVTVDSPIGEPGRQAAQTRTVIDAVAQFSM